MLVGGHLRKALSKLGRGGKAGGVRGKEFQVGGTACAEAKRQERAGVFREREGPVSAWGPELGEEGRTQPPTGPWCQLSSLVQGSRVPSEPGNSTVGHWEELQSDAMCQRLL